MFMNSLKNSHRNNLSELLTISTPFLTDPWIFFPVEYSNICHLFCKFYKQSFCSPECLVQFGVMSAQFCSLIMVFTLSITKLHFLHHIQGYICCLVQNSKRIPGFHLFLENYNSPCPDAWDQLIHTDHIDCFRSTSNRPTYKKF